MKKFTKYLSDISFADIVYLWNDYASENGYEQIFDSIEEFAANFETEGVELARMVFFGDVKNWGDYVYLNGYGNFQSCWNVENSPIDVDGLAQWMKETNHEDYKQWLENIDADAFADWLGGELTNEELTSLWVEYIADHELKEDEIADNGLPYDFDIEALARELMADWHQLFDNFIDEHI